MIVVNNFDSQCCFNSLNQHNTTSHHTMPRHATSQQKACFRADIFNNNQYICIREDKKREIQHLFYFPLLLLPHQTLNLKGT